MPRQLHIGGTVRKDGWEVFNAMPGPHVDHLGNANDLSQFADGSFAVVYASHVLEHFDYARDLVPVLREWRRVLSDDGRLLISVPDLEVLCSLFLDRRELRPEDRFQVMRMMFGGHVDAYDYHMVGYNDEILSGYLREAGFQGCHRVESHGLFQDTSEMVFRGRRISLNLIAWKTWGTAVPAPPATAADEVI